MSPKQITQAIAAVVAVFALLILWPFTQIGAGERGVVTRLGAYSRTVEPGLHWVTPLIEGVTKFDVQTQKEQVEATAASKDLQNVSASVAVNYNIAPSKIGDLFVTIGAEYKSKVIDPAIQEVTKAVTAGYTAEELITKRPQVTDEIRTQLAERLAPTDITVSNISITEFKFSEAFNDAIEHKVTAEQNALAAKNKLSQVQFEAQQRVAQAEGEAKAISIQAQAINSQGGTDYVMLQAIKQWDGHLPTNMIPGASTPILDLRKVTN
jgi:regulator of protease activity HflC (stomatin/prohibitin superfamily)